MEKTKQKGVTLVETIVAMAIFIIVSAAVFLTCDYSIKVQAQNEVKHFFVVETENVAMCYYSKNFDEALTFLMGENSELIEKNNESKTYTIYYTKDLTVSKSDDAKYKLVFGYENASNPVITCTNLDNGKDVYCYGGENA